MIKPRRIDFNIVSNQFLGICAQNREGLVIKHLKRVISSPDI
jgi:hypothetical protein